MDGCVSRESYVLAVGLVLRVAEIFVSATCKNSMQDSDTACGVQAWVISRRLR